MLAWVLVLVITLVSFLAFRPRREGSVTEAAHLLGREMVRNPHVRSIALERRRFVVPFFSPEPLRIVALVDSRKGERSIPRWYKGRRVHVEVQN